jgi:KDO2-lipid IV(A) lauroyltransferase
MMALVGYAVNTVTQRQRNPHVHRFLERWRHATGQKTIAKDGALRDSIRALRRNELVAMLTDQDARKDGIWVDFLGAPASTHRAPGLLSVRHGVPIVTFAAPRIDRRRYRIAFDPPFVAESTGAPEEDVRRATARISAALEAHIRRWPDQWLWAHRRWKTRPRPAEAAKA